MYWGTSAWKTYEFFEEIDGQAIHVANLSLYISSYCSTEWGTLTAVDGRYHFLHINLTRQTGPYNAISGNVGSPNQDADSKGSINSYMLFIGSKDQGQTCATVSSGPQGCVGYY